MQFLNECGTSYVRRDKYLKKINKNYCRFLIICLCFLSLQSSTINSSIIVPGYVDRVEQLAVILLDTRHEEVIVPKESLPPNSIEGVWVDVVVDDGTYEIIHINERKTTNTRKSITRLRKKLFKK